MAAENELKVAPTPEDWRILRALSFYRLLLVTLQLVLYESGYLDRIFDQFNAKVFHATCIGYAVLALLLLLPIVYRRPSVALQASGQFAVDVIGTIALAYACGGVPSGLGMLVLTSAVGCSMISSPRMALVHASAASLVVLGEEIYRMYPDYDNGPFTQTGILGLMFFATTIAANTVAQRARKSEAFAAQVGSDLASLARLNESVIEHMATGVLVVTAQGRIHLLNDAAARLLHLRRDSVLADAAPGLASALEHWRQGAAIDTSPIAPRTGAEEVVPRFTRLASGAGAPILVLLDPALALREQALQMNLAALGRLSAGIAHEIRNPLTAISHAGQLLAEAPDLSPENQKLLSMIQRHTERIDKIVKDVLALSRRDAPDVGVIRLRSWLGAAVEQYREGHPGQARTIHYDRVAPDFTMKFDAHHLQQVLFNLWDNSFVHGGADGRRVEINLASTSRTSGDPAHLEIRDNGPGIGPELRDRIFEPFFSTAHTGTGLGLYLARELCEYNHARLTYRATHDGGACFRLVFTGA